MSYLFVLLAVFRLPKLEEFGYFPGKSMLYHNLKLHIFQINQAHILPEFNELFDSKIKITNHKIPYLSHKSF